MWVIFASVAFADLLAFLYLVWTNQSNAANIKNLNVRWPVESKPILSPPELRVSERLRAALPGYFIYPQVSMCSIIEVEGNRYNPHFWLMFNRFAKMSVDFLVCDERNKVVCAIEIDDATHLQERRIKADRVKTHALESAGIRLIRWQARSTPSVDVMKKEVIQ